MFGGQVLAQALVAAGRTVDADIPVHSLHAYFLRPGDPETPIVFDVDRIRDGRSFVTRRVVAIQHGRAIFNMAASFHVVEDGPAHSDPMPDVPAPEDRPGQPASRVAASRPTRPQRRGVAQGTTDRDALRRHAHLGAHRTERRRPGSVAARRRHAARRPDPARGDRGVRVRLHAAQHRRAPALAGLGPRDFHVREPRPRDVVPPAVPRRRMAAVPLPQPGGGHAVGCRPVASSVATASSASRSRRKA